MMGNFLYNSTDLVFFNGVVAEWSLIKLFIDKRVSGMIRKATEAEKIKWQIRPEGNK